jgi:hypothetical protein
VNGLAIQIESAAATASDFVLDQRTTSATGAFEFAVAEGRYWLRVDTTPRMPRQIPVSIQWTDLEVDVHSDIDGLEVALRRGATARGVVQLDEGTGLPPTTPRILLALKPALDGPGSRMMHANTGAFFTGELKPGRYFFDVTGIPQGFWLKSVTVAGRDVTTTGLDLTAGSVDDVRVTLTNQVGRLTGRVRDAGGQPYGQASVIVFPEDEAQWRDGGTRPRTIHVRPATLLGRFEVGNLVAGDYLVAAIPSDALQNPNTHGPTLLLRVATLATRVRIEPRAELELDLNLVSPAPPAN